MNIGMRKKVYIAANILFIMGIISAYILPTATKNIHPNKPRAVVTPTKKFLFNSFVDCNMAEAWIGDTFRIFPGKYGEDPLWGNARDLKFANGSNADEAFH